MDQSLWMAGTERVVYPQARQMGKQDVIADYGRYVNPGRVEVYRALGIGFVPGRRQGVWLWDSNGSRRLLNCRSSGGVFNLGHRPPRIVAALREAMSEFDVGDHVLLTEPRAALGERLSELTPGDIQYTTFSPGGAEAMEVLGYVLWW